MNAKATGVFRLGFEEKQAPTCEHTFLLEVQDDGGVDGGDCEVSEGAVLQLHVQSD